ncbi:MAG: dienelactone hydrolase family protein [Stellaceae bacterium]
MRTKITIPPMMDDIAARFASTDQRSEVKRESVGCYGYCRSGPYAFAAAARYPERIAAAASFYGTSLASEAEEGSHRSLAKTKGKLYIACAEKTIWHHANGRGAAWAIQGSRAVGEIELYPGVHHKFAFRSTGAGTSQPQSATGNTTGSAIGSG